MYLSMFLGPFVQGFADEKAIIDLSIDQALEADEVGFTGIYLGEQHHNNYEPYSDPFTIGGYLAAKLQEAYVGTTVVSLVLHHPLMLIERINLLDQLTRGKCIIGMSSGQPFNGTAFGIHEWGGDTRQRLFQQRLELLLRAWAHRPEDGSLSFETDHENGVMTGRVMPYSYRVPHPLFAVGTSTPAKLVQAGRAGHLVHLGPHPLDQAVERMGQYKQGLEEGGHLDDLEEKMKWFFSTKWIYVSETDESAYAEADEFFGMNRIRHIPWLKDKERYEGLTLRELEQADPGSIGAGAGEPESPAAWVQRCHVIGSPETVALKLKEWEAAGMPHIHARWLMNSDSVELYKRSWRLFVDEVMPRLHVERISAPSSDDIRPEFREEVPELA